MQRTLWIVIAVVISVLAVGILLRFTYNGLYGVEAQKDVNASKQTMPDQTCDETSCAANDLERNDCATPACIRGSCVQSAVLLPDRTLCNTNRGRCNPQGTCVPIDFCPTAGITECVNGRMRRCIQGMDLAWGSLIDCPAGCSADGRTCRDNNAPVIVSLGVMPQSGRIRTPFNIVAEVNDDTAVAQVEVTLTLPDGATQQLTLQHSAGSRYGITYTPQATGTFRISARATDAAGNAATANSQFSVTQLAYRIYYAPIGFSNTAQVNSRVDELHNYLVERTPFAACSDRDSRVQKVVIDPALCQDLACNCHCPDTDASLRAGAVSCIPKLETCFERYKQTHPDARYDLLLGLTALPAPCSYLGGGSITHGCAEGIGQPRASFYWDYRDAGVLQMHLVAHEAGHSLGLCHEKPCITTSCEAAPSYGMTCSEVEAVIGFCAVPNMIDLPFCPNKGAAESQTNMMNYVPSNNKQFSAPSETFLRSSVFSQYLEGCR